MAGTWGKAPTGRSLSERPASAGPKTVRPLTGAERRAIIQKANEKTLKQEWENEYSAKLDRVLNPNRAALATKRPPRGKPLPA